MKSNGLIALVAILALAVGFMLQKHHTGKPAVSAPIPLDFSFPDINGQRQSVAQWKGKILVLNFWASWCPPCLKEIPEFIRWQQELKPQQVQFVGISLDDQKAAANYLQTININYPILVAGDEGAGLAQQLGNIINTVPFTVIVNQQGQIVHRQLGEFSRAQFLEEIRPLLRSNP
ncbi:TlpA family protein disulfide reductase [Methylomonas sp. MgM2]